MGKGWSAAAVVPWLHQSTNRLRVGVVRVVAVDGTQQQSANRVVVFSHCRGFLGPGWLSLASPHNFDRPEHAPLSPAGTWTCTVVHTRARGRELEKRPVALREKLWVSQESLFLS